MNERFYIACDLGADSGRVILGHLKDGILSIEEIHRFSNGPVRLFGQLRWNILSIFQELKTGLRKISARGVQAASLSVDSWGVDYVWFSKSEPQLGMPFNYRDDRTEATYAAALAKATPEVIFEATGTQFMQLNTLYQFIDDVANRPEILKLADQFLNIADYLNYLFSGVAKNEASNASTTQAYDPRKGAWSKTLLDLFNIPERLFPEIVPSGTVLGPVLAEVTTDTGISATTQVVATCSHDTGAAVAAVPAEGNEWAYLSCGTWSLIGVELPEALINEEVRRLNYTNEIGYNNTARFLKNIVGLWIQQECKRQWLKEGNDYSYSEFDHFAAEAQSLRSIINPNAARFLKPDDMPAKIAAFCKETGQVAPETPGQCIRCTLESLALLYRKSLDEIESLTGRKISTLHIVGGGSKSSLLSQFAANATGRTVVAGPVEATAIGNLLVQSLALGHIDSHASLRNIVKASFPVQTFQPADNAEWEAAYQRFLKLDVLS